MARPARGRPRRSGAAASGLGTREDLLLTAGRLFCEVGYGATSTYDIARAAAVSQATMYHYFAGKPDLLLELLLRTVRPSLDAATVLCRMPEAGSARLWALCRLDVDLLVSGADNLGSLYLQPELYGAEAYRFATFHDERQRLHALYRELVAAVLAEHPGGAGAARTDLDADLDADQGADLVFGLVESVILRRRGRRLFEIAGVAPAVADAALRVLGVPNDVLARARARGSSLATRPATGAPGQGATVTG